MFAETELAAILRDASGLDLAQLDRSASFIELGFDSLFLIQLSQRIKKRLGVKIAFRQLIEEVSTISALIQYLQQHSVQPATTSPVVNTAVGNNSVGNTAVVDAAMVPSSPSTSSSRTTDLAATPPAPSPQLSNSTPADVRTNKLTSLNPSPKSPLTQSIISDTGASAASQQRIQSFQPYTPGPSGSAVEQIILQQNQLMMRHLDLLFGGSNDHASHTALELTADHTCSEDCADLHSPCTESSDQPQEASRSSDAAIDQQAVTPVQSTADQPVKSNQSKTFERFGPYKPVRKGTIQGLTESQHQHLLQFIARYTRRTEKSRAHAQNYRAQFADPRGVAGYRRIWKSMVYQIVVERSKGSKLWDIDGNQYIDIAMGFGLNLFGQSPDFITEALHRQLDRGVEVGPQTPLTGEVASLLCQFSRKDRVTFCNTGSEAVMAALRLARTVNGKTKTVFFNKDYHGNFDQVLMRSQSTVATPGSAPAAPGVPQWYADNTIVLPYGDPESLKVIQQHADDIAAVLVEPCQSADPFIQPREFLKQLREITRENHIALVMDEVITGFRAAPGGAQQWYDVWGDMATYGKILGGGMPIGALAGTSEYMDALDGGNWHYEDATEPDADMTFFAGTFVRHPLAIVAAYEVLKRIKEEGPALQQRLTAKTEYLANSLNQFFEQEQFPIRVAQFTSLFRFMFPPDLEFADMLYFHLLDRGIFTRGWGDNCFLSTEHSDDDVERIIEAVKASCIEIREAGFFPEKASSLEPVEKKNAQLALPPLTERMSTVNPIQEEGHRPPLFCMPAADGLTLVYHELSHELGDDQPVYGLDSPAIYREAIPDTLEELAARFIQDIKEIQPQGPYYLVGYCSGGTTALEVAHQLIRSGEQVALLALLETYNWRCLPSTNPTLPVRCHYQFQRLKFHLYNFLLLDKLSKKEFLRSKLNALGNRTKVWRSGLLRLLGRSTTTNREGLVNMDEIWRKHDDIAEAYIAERYPGKIIHFRPLVDYRCNVGEEYDAQELDYRTLKVYPAGMMSQPFVKDLAKQLSEIISNTLHANDHKVNPTSVDQVRIG